MNAPLLELCDVSFAYAPRAWALRHINLCVKEGRKIAILGANGAGKSTLLLLLAGGEVPCLGSLVLDGEPVRPNRDDRRRLRRSVGILLQDPDDQLLAPTVEHDVALGPLQCGASQGEARGLVQQALAAMEISHLSSRPVHELSLGEKKRVALAGLIAMRPRVLLLDEPAAGLDGQGFRALLRLFEELRKTGTAIVQATHDSNLALDWADEVHVLCRSKVLGGGDPHEVLREGELLEAAGIDAPLLLREHAPAVRRER